MRGRQFLDVANYLEALDTEASHRTQISRIYYAVYLEARQWCEAQLGYKRERLGREHQEIAKLLASHDRGIVDELSFLRSYRNTADYDMEMSPETMANQLQDARVFAVDLVSRLDSLKLSPVLDQYDPNERD